MPARPQHRDYYVYVLFRETGQPFYVGKGRGGRWHQHYTACAKYSRDMVAYDIQRRGFEVPRVKVAEDLSQQDAYEIEKAFIQAIGRWPNGPLVNATGGGDGGPGPGVEGAAKIAAKKRGSKLTAKHKAKISAGNKRAYAEGRRDPTLARLGVTTPEATKVKQRDAALARVDDALREHGRKLGASWKGRKRKPTRPAGFTTPNSVKSKIAEGVRRACARRRAARTEVGIARDSVRISGEHQVCDGCRVAEPLP